MEVKPWKSTKWTPPEGEDLITADKLMLNKGATGISKKQEFNLPQDQQVERPGEANLPHVPIVTADSEHHMGAGVRGDSFVR